MKTTLQPMHTTYPQNQPLDELLGQSAGAYHFGAPFYNPPYESAMQDDFAWHLAKYIREDAVLDTNVKYHTVHGATHIDFVLTLNGQKIGFVCIGIRSQDQIERDQQGYASLLADGKLSQIFRLRGIDLYFHIEDCLYLIAQAQKPLFSERGHINLKRLASDDALNVEIKRGSFQIKCEYDLNGGEDEVDRSFLPLMENNTHYVSIERYDRLWALPKRKTTVLPLAA
jgi:hypothetical protein